MSTVNGKAIKHAYTTCAEVEHVASGAEQKLANLKLPLTLRAGAVWIETSGLPVANSYDNRRTGTKITLMRKSTGWVMVNAERVTLYKEGGGAGKLVLTRHQYDEAAKRLLAGIEVLETETA